MKILVISHNVFSDTSSMGKTLSSYFSDFSIDEVSQLYIHSEIPSSYICHNYFRITDKDVLKSIFTRKAGTTYNKDDIKTNIISNRTDTGLTSIIYRKCKNGSSLIHIARNMIWSIGAWNTKKLKLWINEINPDAIFFASGDYSFLYKIALSIAKQRKIHLFVSCMDDYYFYNKNEDKFLGKLQHKLFMQQVKKTIDYSSELFTICDKMTKDYSKYFNKKCVTLHTGSSYMTPINIEKTNKISYIGNLSHNRNIQLLDIAKALKNINMYNKPEFIDVYSSEKRKNIISEFTKENGIDFKGEINSQDVKTVIGQSMIVIHTESFDSKISQTVKYSVSTKIPDSLYSGTCLLAYGPPDIASMEYLIENNSAFCITKKEDLEKRLEEIISSNDLRKKITNNALNIAQKNHNTLDNSKFIVRGEIEKILNRG